MHINQHSAASNQWALTDRLPMASCAGWVLRDDGVQEGGGRADCRRISGEMTPAA
ncbi:hypothetical protein [Streptomyces sp. NPDC046942]|uniref:hypothetical protein n=1 Tax=Streptomyces sp. NPDC046942 TaxID=3155137 RepID=UPI0033DFB9E0